MFQVNSNHLWEHEQRHCEMIKFVRQNQLAREIRREQKRAKISAALLRVVSVFL